MTTTIPAIHRPAWVYECASGEITNPARYQTSLLRHGWRHLTPLILGAHRWGVREFCFHLPFGKIPAGTMDFDAQLHAADRGAEAARLSSSFLRYADALLGRFSESTVTIYLGSLLCESMESMLERGEYFEWSRIVETVLGPLLDRPGINIAIDMSSGLDTRRHPGLSVIEMAERIKLAQGRRLYIEGVPTPYPGRGPAMLCRPVICLEPNWTRATTDAPDDGRDPQRLTGLITRWFSGHFYTTPQSRHRHNAFGNDPIRFLADCGHRGHRVMAPLKDLRDTFRARDFGHFQDITREATERHKR